MGETSVRATEGDPSPRTDRHARVQNISTKTKQYIQTTMTQLQMHVPVEVNNELLLRPI